MYTICTVLSILLYTVIAWVFFLMLYGVERIYRSQNC